MSAADDIKKVKIKYAGRLKIAHQKAAIRLAEYIIDYVKFRTRSEGQGPKGILAELEASTIKFRRNKQDRLHPETSPAFSNLTATGQLLDAMRGRAAKGKVTVDIKPTKRRKELSGRTSGLTNEQVRHFVEIEREFLKLSKEEKDDVLQFASELIAKNLRGLS